MAQYNSVFFMVLSFKTYSTYNLHVAFLVNKRNWSETLKMDSSPDLKKFS